jgi:F-type H+-transporting ATPase subunit delta
MFLLLDKGRIESLPGISREFSRLADKQRNILNITIMTAVPLDQAGIDRISEKFRHLYQASSVKVTLDVQPSLIGGVKVAVGDKLYDGTVKGKLAGLQAILSGK